jgi:acyl-CoA hydrolase
MNGKTVRETSLKVSYAVMPSDANPAGNVHGGVIMKHIDNTGGIVALRHARRFCVTASVDRLDFHNPGYIGELLTLKSSLNLVGRTSMEIGVRVEAENMISGEIRHIASAYLTYVSLDDNRKPMPVPPLILESEEDHRRNREAAERRRMRFLEKKKETTG